MQLLLSLFTPHQLFSFCFSLGHWEAPDQAAAIKLRCLPCPPPSVWMVPPPFSASLLAEKPVVFLFTCWEALSYHSGQWEEEKIFAKFNTSLSAANRCLAESLLYQAQGCPAFSWGLSWPSRLKEVVQSQAVLGAALNGVSWSM